MKQLVLIIITKLGLNISLNSWVVFSIWTDTYLSFKVRADPDNTSLDSHLEGETDDPSDL